MSTIQKNRKEHLIFVIILLVALTFNSFDLHSEMNKKDSIYAFSIEVNPGVNLLLNQTVKKEERNLNPNIQGKIFWKPNSDLSIGIECGFIDIMKRKENIVTESGKTNMTLRMSGIPLNLIFKMNFNDFYLFGGFGITFINSEVTAYNDLSITNKTATSYLYGLGYELLHFSRFGIGIEGKSWYIIDIDKYLFGVNLTIKYDLIKF